MHKPSKGQHSAIFSQNFSLRKDKSLKNKTSKEENPFEAKISYIPEIGMKNLLFILNFAVNLHNFIKIPDGCFKITPSNFHLFYSSQY